MVGAAGAQLARHELDSGADHGERVVGGGERRRAVAGRGARVVAVQAVGERLEDRVAPCGRARPRADDLDEQRLRGVAVVGECVEEGADARRDVLVVAAVRRAPARPPPSRA